MRHEALNRIRGLSCTSEPTFKGLKRDGHQSRKRMRPEAVRTTSEFRTLRGGIGAAVSMRIGMDSAFARFRTTSDVLSEMRKWLPLMRVLVRAASGLQKIRAILEYVLHVSSPDQEGIRSLLREVDPAVEEDYMTTLADRLRG